jgi:hypothetical protein
MRLGPFKRGFGPIPIGLLCRAELAFSSLFADRAQFIVWNYRPDWRMSSSRTPPSLASVITKAREPMFQTFFGTLLHRSACLSASSC